MYDTFCKKKKIYSSNLKKSQVAVNDVNKQTNKKMPQLRRGREGSVGYVVRKG